MAVRTISPWTELSDSPCINEIRRMHSLIVNQVASESCSNPSSRGVPSYGKRVFIRQRRRSSVKVTVASADEIVFSISLGGGSWQIAATNYQKLNYHVSTYVSSDLCSQLLPKIIISFLRWMVTHCGLANGFRAISYMTEPEYLKQRFSGFLHMAGTAFFGYSTPTDIVQILAGT